MASDDYGFPVKLGQHVSWHPGHWMWRIEVREPNTMAAAWFTHDNLSAILGTDSHDPAIVRKLVQWRRDEIQECISIAAMEHWPEELGTDLKGLTASPKGKCRATPKLGTKTIAVSASLPRRVRRTREAPMTDPGADMSDVRAANDIFYKALSAGSIEGISAACAHDDDVTALHENSKTVAVGWQAVLDTWKAIPFGAFSELSVEMSDPAIKLSGLIARVVGLEKVRGKMKDGQDFAWTALGTNIYEKRDGKWLIVHHHASKAAEELVS